MKPKWQKLASLAQKNARSSLSSMVHPLLPKDTILRTYLNKKWYTGGIQMMHTVDFTAKSSFGA